MGQRADAAEAKEENIQDKKWRPADQRARGRVKQIKTKEVKQEDTSKYGAELRFMGTRH